MIRILLFVLALLLLFCSYYLRKKNAGLFLLIEKNRDNQSFFRNFAISYGILGILGLVIGFLNQTNYSLLYLVVVLICSAIFSLRFAGKMKKS